GEGPLERVRGRRAGRTPGRSLLDLPANQLPGVAGVQQAVGQCEVGPAGPAQDRGAGLLLVFVGGGHDKDQVARLAQEEERLVGRDEGAATEARLGPADLAGLPVDAAELGADLLPAGEAVELAADGDGGAEVAGEGLLALPDFPRAVAGNVEEHVPG